MLAASFTHKCRKSMTLIFSARCFSFFPGKAIIAKLPVLRIFSEIGIVEFFIGTKSAICHVSLSPVLLLFLTKTQTVNTEPLILRTKGINKTKKERTDCLHSLRKSVPLKMILIHRKINNIKKINKRFFVKFFCIKYLFNRIKHSP